MLGRGFGVGLVVVLGCSSAAAPAPSATPQPAAMSGEARPREVKPVTDEVKAPEDAVKAGDAGVGEAKAEVAEKVVLPEGVVAGVEPSAKLEVEARLVETASAPHCGVVHFVVVMRYEVVRVISGSYPGKDLYVAHSCPEMGSTACKGQPGERVKRWEQGALHRLQLTRGKGHGAVVDEFADKTLPRYRARCVNGLSPG